MKVKTLGFIGLIILPSAAPATEHEVAAYGALLDACYAAAEDKTSCIGQMSGTCMESQEGGQTTLGMASCLMAEATVWDRHLNAEYGRAMTALKAMDADEAEYSADFAKRAESLRAAQRAWIAFRDGECGLAYAMWGSGSMRTIAAAECKMSLTAERAIELGKLGSEIR